MRTSHVPAAAMRLLAVAFFAAACSPAAAPTPTSAPKEAAKPAAESKSAADTKPAADAKPASASVDAEWQAIVEAGKKEGKITIYGPFIEEIQAPYVEAFQKKYPGIEIEVVYGTGPQSAERIRTEVAAGKVVADIWRGATDPALAMRDAGILEKWQAPSVVRERNMYSWLPTDEDEQGYMTNVVASTSGIMANVNVVKEADLPTSWWDLADPKYKGKILWYDPRRPGAGQSLTWFWTQTQGAKADEFLRAFAQNDLALESNTAKIAEDVARGEQGLGVPTTTNNYEAKKGPHTRFIIPKEGSYYSITNMVIPKGAPHPNAAKLWIEWEASKEGQQVKAELGSEVVVRKDVPTKEKWLSLETAGPWAGVTFADRLTKQNEMGEQVKKYFPNP
jgi:iron(III) transport system substrate-binding protein